MLQPGFAKGMKLFIIGMRFAALVSGGKDSVYSICKLQKAGHILVGLIHMRSTSDYSDSYMFQTVGSNAAALLGECFGVPIFIADTACHPCCMSLEYSCTNGDEVEDLFCAVKAALKEVSFEGLCSGAILSNYQKKRVENVCGRLNIESLTPLWGADQKQMLLEMIQNNIKAQIIKIASPLLEKRCLGMSLLEIYDYLTSLKGAQEINYCGEGGEYETIVLDCEQFKKRIVPGKQVVQGHPEERGRKEEVFYLEYAELSLEDKCVNF